MNLRTGKLKNKTAPNEDDTKAVEALNIWSPFSIFSREDANGSHPLVNWLLGSVD